MSPSVPASIRERVARRVYADANQFDWMYLTSADRTRQYSRWLDDPEVGGLLEPLLGRSGARLWLKDGPLHEYSRAVAGIGPYARFTASRATNAEQIVRGALGE